MKTIYKKIWPGYFQAVDSGEKTFEVRNEDAQTRYDVGDNLMLEEWDPTTRSYTGKICHRVISYIMPLGKTSFGTGDNTIVLGLRSPVATPNIDALLDKLAGAIRAKGDAQGERAIAERRAVKAEARVKELEAQHGESAPVAWLVEAKGGNVIYWTTKEEEEAKRVAAKYDREAIPLYRSQHVRRGS